jgi:hypothetical protein
MCRCRGRRAGVQALPEERPTGKVNKQWVARRIVVHRHDHVVRSTHA